MPDYDLNDTEHIRYPAPFAALSKNSRGRRFPIPRIPYRSAYQRDRDRIIHSTAFRRLQHKTQVFANLGEESDHYRSRLTHTIEVAQISRTIARMLGLNEDLAEAVALAHDLGHTPFGHAGEKVLDNLLADEGGFNHNVQSLRVVDFLEKRYPEHFGLNLTYELREAIIKHETHGTIVIPEEFNPEENPLLEGQIVNYADEIAYNGHDVDDGLSSGLLTLDDLREADLFAEIFNDLEKNLTEKSETMVRFALVRLLVNGMVIDLYRETDLHIKRENIESTADVRECQKRLVTFSADQAKFNLDLKAYLNRNMYRHPSLNEMSKRSEEIIVFLFNRYLSHPEDIPGGFIERYGEGDLKRRITDYVAGMTDRFALAEFKRLQKE